MFGFLRKKRRRLQTLDDAIRSAEKKGYIVDYDAEINGHEFYASIRLTKPPCNYLTTVECFDSESPLTRQQLDEAANRASDAKTDMCIVIASGFEAGCEEIYQLREDVRLATFETINMKPTEEVATLFTLILNKYNFRFLQPSQRMFLIPNEAGIVKSMMQDARIESPGISVTPEELVSKLRNEAAATASGVRKELKIDLPPATEFIHPNTLERTKVLSFIFDYQLVTTAEVEGINDVNDSPYIIDQVIERELARRNAEAVISDLGFDTLLEPGKYYFNPHLLFSYYCERANKKVAELVLVESYQENQLVQARLELDVTNTNQFVEVTNAEEIERLTKLYERYVISDRNLKGRFQAFLREFENTEWIDELDLTAEQQKAQKADYFFENRKIICEQKSLENDSSWKVEKILNKYRDREEFPLIFGSVGLQQVLRHFPDGEKINREIADAVSDAIEDAIESANRQIRETKRTFNLPDAGGLLVILNDLVYSLPPKLVAYRIPKTLQKRTMERDVRFPHVSAVLVLHTAHATQVNPHLRALPILAFRNVLVPDNVGEPFLDKLQEAWSIFEGVPLIPNKNSSLDVRFDKNPDPRAKKGN